jgi:hypothetical protein
VHWEARLTGPRDAIAELARQFTGTELLITNQGILRSSTIDRADSADTARSEADRIALALSGICRLLIGTDQTIRVDALTQIRDDGKRNIFMTLEPGVLRITGGLISTVVTRADGSFEERRASDPAPRWFSAALTDPRIARALALRDAKSLSWTDLYRLFEVISAGVRGDNQLISNGWTSRATIGRFKHSANSVTVAGDEARHGVEITNPPSNPMSHGEAKEFIDSLLRHWFESGAV